MAIAEEIKAAYASARNYPELTDKLIYAGIRSYTVDVATGITLYRLQNGSIHLQTSNAEPRDIAKIFDEALTIQAIRDNQQGKTDYAGFMNDITNAGVRFYEATLNGNSKRVTYIGTGGFYEELIPV
jgi:uncharacterized protein YbcV (DUF1398 family)